MHSAAEKRDMLPNNQRRRPIKMFQEPYAASHMLIRISNDSVKAIAINSPASTTCMDILAAAHTQAKPPQKTRIWTVAVTQEVEVNGKKEWKIAVEYCLALPSSSSMRTSLAWDLGLFCLLPAWLFTPAQVSIRKQRW